MGPSDKARSHSSEMRSLSRRRVCLYLTGLHAVQELDDNKLDFFNEAKKKQQPKTISFKGVIRRKEDVTQFLAHLSPDIYSFPNSLCLTKTIKWVSCNTGSTSFVVFFLPVRQMFQ